MSGNSSTYRNAFNCILYYIIYAMRNNKVNNLFRRIRLQRCTNFWVIATITSMFSLLHFSVGVAIGRYAVILECIICTRARVCVDKQYVRGKKNPKVKHKGERQLHPAETYISKNRKNLFRVSARRALILLTLQIRSTPS